MSAELSNLDHDGSLFLATSNDKQEVSITTNQRTPLAQAKQIHSVGFDHDYADINKSAETLRRLSGEFKTSLVPASNDERDLLRLATDCNKVADELLGVLEESIILPGSPWQSFRQALRNAWSKDKIKKMEKKLKGLRNGMAMCLSKMIFQTQSRVVRTIHDLSEQTRVLKIDMADSLEGLRASVNDVLQEFKSERVNNLSEKLSKMKIMFGDTSQITSILTSLEYDAIYDRVSQVTEAHHQTFEWIFHTSMDVPTSAPIPQLREWLKSRSGVYWITGKPGSGKSTLLKWLWSHSETRRLLERWAGTQKLIIGSHFFWSGGRDIQKSQEGLLRSMLLDAFRSCPELIPLVVGSRWETNLDAVRDRSRYHMRPWSYKELSVAFAKLSRQNIRPKFCFFVDGLDEYDGDHEEIVELIKEASKSSDLKFCVSSRPWNVFHAAFGDSLDKLKLEYLNKGDIKRFAEDKLGLNRHFQLLQTKEPRCSDLVQEIVESSQGVFLWIFLVVRSLLKGLTNADNIHELQRRLKMLPPTLDKFFRHILHSTDEVYYGQQARFFLIAQQGYGPLSLMMYSYVDEDEAASLSSDFEPTSDLEKMERLRRMHTRMNAQCSGLLECVSKSRHSEAGADIETLYQRAESGKFLSPISLSQSYEVNFLHRTVKDFIATKELDDLLKSRCQKDFKPLIAIIHASITEIKSLDLSIHTERLKAFC